MSIDDCAADVPESDGSSRDERLFAAHYLPVMRLCLRRLGDVDDAEDAVQEVFRRAVQHGADLRDDPLPWLITVAKHVCLDELRRRRAGRAAVERSAFLSAGGDVDAPDAAANPERVVVGHMFVRELLGRLTPAERRVMAARVYQANSSTDTAELLGVSSSTTRVLLARARQKLRAYLEEGQGALAGFPLLVTRSLHGLRRRLLERPWLGEQARSAVLLPAAVIITVAWVPGAQTGGNHAGLPLAGRPALLTSPAQNGTGVSTAAHPAVAPADSRESHWLGAEPTNPSRSGGPNVSPLLPAFEPDVQRVNPTDVESSPNYSSDNTIYLLGQPANCTCTELFRSTDGGARWTYVGAPGLQGVRLILPDTTVHGQFYAYGMDGLQMTKDGGRTFTNVSAPLGGFAVAAPTWSGLGVVLSNYALWQIEGILTKPLAALGPAEQAVGAPLFIQDQAGTPVILQPVNDRFVPGPHQTPILRCSHTCSAAAVLPFETGTTQLVASATRSVDHTIFALGVGQWLAVSHDDGLSFSPPKPTQITAMLALSTAGGQRRLLALMPRDQRGPSLATSDDDGATWQWASVDPALHLRDSALTINALAPGSLIASLVTEDSARVGFACSADGGTWRACGEPTVQ